MNRNDTAEARRLAQRVRQACLRAALEAWEEGGIAGLCAEGRWELAVDAVRALDLEPLLVEDRGDGGS
ncbi:MAG TPA: acetyltransferase [Gammaproteobacteria bacterium]|nr:acetyltransferase [Gammaproteobacteria bacterium]